MTLPAREDSPGVALDIYQLTGTRNDLAFLKKGIRQLEKQRKPETTTTMVPSLPRVNWKNHQELVYDGFEMSQEMLERYTEGRSVEPPSVLAAVRRDTKDFVGLALSHIERPLADGARVYTPLKTHLAQDKAVAEGETPNHTSINWLFSLSTVRGVGAALAATFASQLPPSVQRIDVVSATPDLTPQASALYQRLGFQAIPNMENEKPIPRSPKTPETNLQTFAQMHGIPMSVDRQTFECNTAQVRNAFQFKPVHSNREVILNREVNFPEFPKPVES